MGGYVSSGRDNDELIDNLIDSHYIVTKKVENVFRTVDRGNYFLCKHKAKDLPYMDSAWREGNLHLSAPGIYSKVVEALDLKRGQSFLNMGSGTGYLSTMVGLIIGCAPTSRNHGIEYHDDVIEYAVERLEEFIRTCTAFDEYEFCAPVFIQGNCLKLSTCVKYDRIYCGAECNDTEHLELIKSLMSVGGIAVIPFNARLLKIHKGNDGDYSEANLLSVSFASLFLPVDGDEDIQIPENKAESLKALCRTSIRGLIRRNIQVWKGDLNVRRKPRERASNKKFRITRLQILSNLAAADESDDEEISEDAESVDHEESMNPGESVDPEESVDSGESVDITEPVNPTEPGDPVELSDSVGSENPVEQDIHDDIEMAVAGVEPTEMVNEQSPVLSTSLSSLSSSACGTVEEAVTKWDRCSSTPGESTDSGICAETLRSSPSSSDKVLVDPKPRHCFSLNTGQPPTDEDDFGSPNKAHCQKDLKCSNCGANQQDGGASGSSSNPETEAESLEHEVLERQSPVPSDHSERSGDLSDLDEDDADHLSGRSSGPAVRGCYTSSPEQCEISPDDERERLHNRNRANLYHTSFANAMATRVSSLPLPSSVRSYLLYYRKVPRNDLSST